jgi:hypothetical protein
MLGPVGFLPGYDSCYRVHAEQTSRQRRAPDHYRLIEHLDRLLAEHAPALRVSAAARARQRAYGLLSVALDDAERGERRRAARHIAAAGALAPRALLSRRALGALAATLGSKRIRRRIGTLSG